MRILHTSDWHLGRSLGNVSFLDDQRAFTHWMLDEVASRQVDLVVIAGDIFDRPVAPNDALVLFRETLRALQNLRVQVAVITGNHDGSDRVANYHDLLDAGGVFLRGGYAQTGEVLTLQFADGPLQLVPLPFLDPQLAPDEFGDVPTEGEGDAAGDALDAADGVDAVYARRMRRTHQSVLRDAIAAAQVQMTVGVRSLAVSHAYVLGATTSESERNLTVGGHGEVEASLFDPFSYTALGHLHRPQRVAGKDTLRYSGTPLAYSFSEDHAKSITIVDIAADGACTIEEVPVPVGRGVFTVVGTIDELVRHEPTPSQRQSLVRAVVTDRGVVLDAKQRLLQVYPYVVEIILQPAGVAEGVAVAAVTGPRLSAMQTTEQFWLESVGAEPSPAELALLRTAITNAEAVTA